MPGRIHTRILISAAQWIALASSLALVVYGSIATHIFAQHYWEPAGWRRFEQFVLYYMAASLVAIAMRPALLPRIVLTAAVTYTVLGVGATPFLSVIAFLFCCYVLGSFVTEGACAVMTGLGAYIMIVFFLVRWPVNCPALYVALMVLPLAVARERTAACGRKCFAGITQLSSDNRLDAAAFTMAALVLSTHLIVALKPDVSADGLAMHLAIPADVAYHRQYTFRPDQVLWAVMPMGGDWAYTFVYVLGGEFAAKLLNFAMMLVVAGLVFRTVRERSSAAPAWLATALFASMPFVQLVTGSLFIENILAAFCFASLAELWRFRQRAQRSALLASAFLLGSAVAVKFGATAFVVAELAAGLVLAGRRFAALPRRGPAAAAMIGLFLAPACLPYVNAWRSTGNPVYPFLNERIPSPLLERDVAFEDQRLRQPLRWRTPYDLTFQTSRFSEGQDGSAGFVMLALLPGAALLLMAAWKRDAIALSSLAVFAIYAVIVFKSTPNFRYLYPVLPLVCVGIGAALQVVKGRGTALRYAFGCAVTAVTAAQFCMMPSSGWYQKDFYIRKLFHRDDTTFVREHAPVRALVAWLNENAPDQPVLFVRDDQIAGLHGLAYSTVWHHYPFLRLLYQCQTAEDVRRMTERLGIRWFIGPFDMDNFSPPLNEFLAKDTVQKVILGNYYVSEARTGGVRGAR